MARSSVQPLAAERPQEDSNLLLPVRKLSCLLSTRPIGVCGDQMAL
jgi:hypothetical protein